MLLYVALKYFICWPLRKVSCYTVESNYTAAKYDNTLTLQPTFPITHVPWTPIRDPTLSYPKYPWYDPAKPWIVELHPGDVLYLPALWYHSVRQRGSCVIAVNWWYDMEYGHGFAMSQFMQDIGKLLVSKQEGEKVENGQRTW